MNREDALTKILKCLRLSKSANEHESAAALRQAQKLMQMHGVSDRDVLAAEVGEARAKSGATRRPPAWEVSLANVCADAFGCELLFHSGASWMRVPGEYRFIGADNRQVLCQYAFVVLIRQCRRARSEYIKAKLRRCGPRQRTARADDFCSGWVYAVHRTVQAFAWTDEQRTAIAAWKHANGVMVVRKMVVAERKARGSAGDGFAGLRAGSDVRLDRPVGGRQQDALA